MSRPHIPIKAKRNNFTLTKEAQSIVDRLKPGEKSKFISNLIESSDKYLSEEKKMSESLSESK